MDAVLPLISKDLPRVRLLLRSLNRFVEGLDTLWVYTPESQKEDIATAFEGMGLKATVHVCPETELVPELRLFSGIGGWYKQQMIKLAAARKVKSDFYLTLDADVVATRELSLSSLTPNNRALAYIIQDDLHPHWYQRVENLLGQKLRRKGVVHNVTPAVLSSVAVGILLDTMGQRLDKGMWSPGIRGLKQRWVRFRSRSSFDSGHLFLLAGLPWTEYALYYSFLEMEAIFDSYHQVSPACIYDIDRSVWYRPEKGLSAWDPKPSFQGRGPPWFLVVQSNTHLDPRDVERVLGPLIDGKAAELEGHLS